MNPNFRRMVRSFRTVGVFGGTILIALAAVGQTAEGLHGTTGKDARWYSGWLDLPSATNFAKGDQLRLSIGGSAKKVAIRLLDDPRKADSADGVIGVFDVGSDRIVRITLDIDYKGIQQISVHGGPSPWNLFDLGGGNGAATLTAAQLIRSSKK
jgi:hypothetical protein